MAKPRHNFNTGDPVIIDTGIDYELGVFILDERNQGKIFHIEMHTGQYATYTGNYRVRKFNTEFSKIRKYSEYQLNILHAKYLKQHNRILPKKFTDESILQLIEEQKTTTAVPSWEK